MDKNWISMSDKTLAKHIGAFVKHHRMEQNISQELLAKNAGISRSTLSLLEHGETVTLTSLLQVLRVLDQLKVIDVFSVEKTMSPLMMAKIEREKRQRVSKSKNLMNKNNSIKKSTIKKNKRN
jgi:transcriptional regulator with XRE-family HTH domain